MEGQEWQGRGIQIDYIWYAELMCSIQTVFKWRGRLVCISITLRCNSGKKKWKWNQELKKKKREREKTKTACKIKAGETWHAVVSILIGEHI